MLVQKAGDGNSDLELWRAMWPLGLLFVVVKANIDVKTLLDLVELNGSLRQYFRLYRAGRKKSDITEIKYCPSKPY